MVKNADSSHSGPVPDKKDDSPRSKTEQTHHWSNAGLEHVPLSISTLNHGPTTPNNERGPYTFTAGLKNELKFYQLTGELITTPDKPAFLLILLTPNRRTTHSISSMVFSQGVDCLVNWIHKNRPVGIKIKIAVDLEVIA